MSFKQYVAKVKKLVNNCDIENAEAKESMIQNFIVTGINSQTAYRQCVEAGPGAKLDKILDIYRNKAAVQAYFSSRHHKQECTK